MVWHCSSAVFQIHNYTLITEKREGYDFNQFISLLHTSRGSGNSRELQAMSGAPDTIPFQPTSHIQIPAEYYFQLDRARKEVYRCSPVNYT